MQLLFATNNHNKLKEVTSLLTGYPYKVVGLKDLKINCEIPETKPTIEGNALQKVHFIKKRFNIDCFADDTGLIVDSLDGAPGVYSARYAGPQASSQENMAKLLIELDNSKDRYAYFKTCIALHLNNTVKIFTGECRGKIIEHPRGSKGFGYDPIFVPHGYDKTFAEMPLEVKNKISHRALAMNKFIKHLKSLKN